MTVYVDNFQQPYKRMSMSHLTADSREELLAFAKLLGLKEEWKQSWDNHRFHFDIAATKRRQAIALGAKSITWKEMGLVIADRNPRNLA